MRRRGFKTSLFIVTTIVAGALLASGCVSVPEQTRIVNKGIDEDRSVTENSCDISQAQLYSDKNRKSAHQLDSNNITVLNESVRSRCQRDTGSFKAR